MLRGEGKEGGEVEDEEGEGGEGEEEKGRREKEKLATPADFKLK
jgi:hypothetical protein